MLHHRSASTFLALVVLATASVTGAVALGVEEIGRWPYGPATTVTRDGDLVYFGNGSTLQVLRVTTPNTFEMLAEIELDNGALDIVVHDNLLYIATGWHGLQVVDIDDPNAPRVVATKRIGGYAYTIAIADDVAWVSTFRSGIQAIDISDPTDLVRVGAVVPSAESFGLTIADGLLWATSDQGLHAIEITDPTQPRVLSTTLASRAFDVRVVDQLAYTAANFAGLEIFDVEDPANPAFLGRFDHGVSQTTDVEIAGSTAYLTSYGTLWVVDVSDPRHPYEVARNEDVGYGRGRSMALDDDWLAIAHAHRGLHVLDVSDRTEPEIVATRPTAGYQGALGGIGDVVFLASVESGDHGFRAIDISDPTSPTMVGDPVGPAELSAEDLVVIGEYAYVASNHGEIHIFDVQEPSYPVFARTHDLPSRRAYGVATWDGHLLVAGGSGGLSIYHLNHPTTPIMIATLELDGVYGVTVSDGIAYLVGSELGLVQVDLTDPSDPRVIHQHSDFYAFRVAVDDDTAYVAAGNEGLIIIDVSVSLTPREVARIENGSVRDVVVNGHRAVVETVGETGCYSTIRFLDVSDPADPVDRGFQCSGSFFLSILDRYLAVASHSSGLSLVDLDAVFEPRPYETVPRTQSPD